MKLNKLTPKAPLFRIGIGAVQFGLDYGFGKTLSQSEVNQILEAASKGGINFLDTARDYGDSEQKIGVYCQKNPQSYFAIATKLTEIDEKTAGNAEKIKIFIENSIENSRNALGKSVLPLLLLHQTDSYITESPYFWEALKDAKGKYAAFGVSVYDPGPTKEIIEKRGDLIDCIQAPYNLLDRRFEDKDLIELLGSKNIAFISRSTFLKGALVEEENKIPWELEGLIPIRKKLKNISDESGFSVPQLLLLFALEAQFIDCILIGVRSANEVRENLEILNSKKLGERFKKELLSLRVDDPFLIDPRQWKTL